MNRSTFESWRRRELAGNLHLTLREVRIKAEATKGKRLLDGLDLDEYQAQQATEETLRSVSRKDANDTLVKLERASRAASERDDNKARRKIDLATFDFLGESGDTEPRN